MQFESCGIDHLSYPYEKDRTGSPKEYGEIYLMLGLVAAESYV